MSTLIKPFIGLAVVGMTLLAASPAQAQVKYETNKFKLKEKVKQGGWVVAWSNDISETDVLRGVLAGGVSIYSANPAPFYAWVDSLVAETSASLARSANQKFPAYLRGQVKTLAATAISNAIRGKRGSDTTRIYGRFEVKVGAIRYSGRNYIYGFGGRKHTLSRTWGMKPYIAIRVR